MAHIFKGVAAALLVALLCTPAPAAAQAHSERPITLFAPWAVGTDLDAAARLMALLLERELGRPVNLINRAGALGLAGYEALASAKPDGQVFGFLTAELFALRRAGATRLSGADFAPVALVSGPQTAGRPDAIGGWCIVAAPRGIAADARTQFLAALEKVHASPELRELMTRRGLPIAWAGPEETARFMARSEAGSDAR